MVLNEKRNVTACEQVRGMSHCIKQLSRIFKLQFLEPKRNEVVSNINGSCRTRRGRTDGQRIRSS